MENIDLQNRLQYILNDFHSPFEICTVLDSENKEDLAILYILSTGTFIDDSISGINSRLVNRVDLDNIPKVNFLTELKTFDNYDEIYLFDIENFSNKLQKIKFKTINLDEIKDTKKISKENLEMLENALNSANIRANSIEAIFDENENFSQFSIKYFEEYEDFDVIERTILI